MCFLLHDTEYSLYVKHYPKFRWNLPEMSVPHGKTIYKYVKRFWTAGFILDSKRTCRRPVKLWKSLGEIGVGLEISKKSLAWLGLSGCNKTKLMYDNWLTDTKQNWILWTGAFRGYRVEKLTPHSFYLMLKLGLTSVDTYQFVVCRKYCGNPQNGITCWWSSYLVCFEHIWDYWANFCFLRPWILTCM
jgi:hypothetical protein